MELQRGLGWVRSNPSRNCRVSTARLLTSLKACMPGALRQSIDDDEIARGAGVLPARMKQAAPGSDVKTLGKDPKQLRSCLRQDS